MSPPPATDHDDPRIGEGDDGRQDTTHRRTEDLEQPTTGGTTAVDPRQEGGDVHRAGPRGPHTHELEDLGQRDGPAAGTRRQHVGDLAGQPMVAAAYLPVADDGASEALAEMDVREVVELPGAGRGGLRPRGPVDVVVHDDRPRHAWPQD